MMNMKKTAWEKRAVKPVLEGIENKLENPNVLVVGETSGNKFIEAFIKEEGGTYAHANEIEEALEYLNNNNNNNIDLIIASYDQHESLINGLNGDNIPLLVESTESPYFNDVKRDLNPEFDFNSINKEVQEKLLSYEGFTGLLPHYTWPVRFNGNLCHPSFSDFLKKFIIAKPKEVYRQYEPPNTGIKRI